jgi:RNA polymerase sigma-70 factor, ECF subfamily
MENRSDEELLGALAKGNEAAFVTVYRRRQGAIYRYAMQMTGSAERASEVTQEVFLALMQQAGKLDASRGTVLSWLYAVARRQVWKQAAVESQYVGVEEDFEWSTDPREEFENADLRAQLRALIPTLPVAYREVLALCIVAEMTYAEAARIAEVPEGTIRSRLHRAKAMLAEKLAPAVRRAM